MPHQDTQPTSSRPLEQEPPAQEDDQSQPPWKQRYRELVEEWESDQLEYREITRVLRNSLSLIAILGEGQHPDLDRNVGYLESTKAHELDLARVSLALQEISDTLFQLSKDPGHPNIGPNPFQTKLSTEFQTFLTKVAEQLSEIEQYLASKGKLSNAAANSTEAMNQAVKLELSEISDSFDSCADIETLQRSVRGRLERIELSVMEHLREQEDLRHKSAAEVERVMDKLQDLEHESRRLRAQLIEERAQAQIDPLTSVYNRKALDQRLEQELKRCARYGSKLSVALWDLDSFKSINDTYGHVIGDKVLKTIGGILSAHSRKTDMTARYGGEEFVCLLPETPVEIAEQVLDKIRERVAKCRFTYQDDKLYVTISCGLTQYKPKDTPETILGRADHGLYKAKQEGKNRIVVA